MSNVPFIGRLFLREYLALVGSFILIGLEIIVRIITLALPERAIRFFYNRSRIIFKRFSSPHSQRLASKSRSIVDPIAKASDFVDLCELHGYYAEEHVVQTKDGYLLGVHRLGWKKGEEEKRVNAGPNSLQKKVVYLHHGLMMNSEVWVCMSEESRCLVFTLVEQGYDVWLGNNRGNKYSKKSTQHSPTTNAFWNFSMDDFAFHDIPDTISYILETTGQPSLSYIGFSQGTAQAFATLSIHPTLNEKVDVFIALAPAMSPPGLANGIVASLVKTSPEVLFLAFGRRSILSSATMWQAILYPPIFVRFIDLSLRFLFGWHTKNITPHQKLAAYPHLYSFSSTKSVVHWFQIIRNGTFQMYDDEVQGPLGMSDSSRYYKVAKFPTRNIKTPIVLVYGGSDSLVDIEIMLKELPRHTVSHEIPKYEHLDLLWASDVDKLVFPRVFEALEANTKPGEKQEQLNLWTTKRRESMPRRMFEIDDKPYDDETPPMSRVTTQDEPSAFQPMPLSPSGVDTERPQSPGSQQVENSRSRSTSPRKREIGLTKTVTFQQPVSPARSASPSKDEDKNPLPLSSISPDDAMPLPNAPHNGHETSSDNASLSDIPTTPSTAHKRSSLLSTQNRDRISSPTRGSTSSSISTEPHFMPGGILIGAGKAVGAVVSREADGQGLIIENRERESRRKKKLV